MAQYRKSPQAIFWDYDCGDYFVTICTKDRKHYFGEIREGEMFLNDIGLFVDSQLSRSHEFCQNVEVIQHVVIPNHIHAKIRISANMTDVEMDTGLILRNPNPSLRTNPTCQRHVPIEQICQFYEGCCDEICEIK